MKKIKIAFLSVSIIGAITVAFATRPKAPCDFLPQYRLHNGSYIPAGEYGLDYYCVGTLGICTWYKPWPSSDWIPCRSGYYLPLDE